MLYMGIDVGTQGVRCIVADAVGRPVASESIPFQRLNIAKQEFRLEQDPADWQSATEASIRACIAQMKLEGRHADEIYAISVDGTSGTILALDADHRPLTNGIMYNDPRAGEQAAKVHAAMLPYERKLGYRFGASFSLPRILWIMEKQPEIYEKTALFAHQADYIAGLLCGEFAVSDYSNALKTGFDLIDQCWPEPIASTLGLDLALFPRVTRPGAPIGRVDANAARRLGLSTQTLVVGGSTDGYASALAAGAVKTGRWASILGTTLVLKGVTDDLLIDPNGSSYSHRLPSGEWLLGGASNIGGRTLNACIGTGDFADLDLKSRDMIPTGIRSYPLPGKGERFPFVQSDCEPFYIGDITGGRLYPAVMEGVAFAERLAYERMRELGCPVGDVICTTGGASRSELWLRIRASVLGRQLKVPRVVDAAMGSAMLAASSHLDSPDALAEAADRMIIYDRTTDPDPVLTHPYDEIYARFREDVRRFYGI